MRRGHQVAGVARMVRYNWPKYATAAATLLVVAVLPWPWSLLTVPGAAGVAVSLAATWWAYDHSRLYDWRWALDLLPANTEPQRYAVVSTGLDEISPALRELLPGAEPTLLDCYDPVVMTEGSVRRARRLNPPPDGSVRADAACLPVRDAGQDAVFLAFAAHELRVPAQRRALFAEVARVLRPGGYLVLVEHCRDAATVAAYGPGAWHFYPRREWLRLARGARLAPAGEATMTPLVRALVFKR
ncbi:class I SAM-dependent methyltransferase [Dactylosporangium sp. NBC_01737]|uniref:class I SAM-dependent methyltransferase n=1 Tax=Dactylosporangium sp. NBC_01737 TaxID=2975959 RepID=UPI002E11C3F8|nr:class I SAM-dependent methyltransferase [Dactylosporangium sp. NBC_01737]